MVTQAKLNRCYKMTKQVLQGDTYRAVGEQEGICTQRVREMVMFFFRWIIANSGDARCGASEHGYCDIIHSRANRDWWLERMKELGFE